MAGASYVNKEGATPGSYLPARTEVLCMAGTVHNDNKEGRTHGSYLPATLMVHGGGATLVNEEPRLVSRSVVPA